MYRKLLSIYILFMLIGYNASAQITFKTLLTENLINPLGLDITQPRFTWILESNTRNVIQTAYEIEVQSNNTTVWNSGQVHADSSVLVAYKGIPLTSNTSYCWKVRVWDNNGNVSNWSESGCFHTGFFHISDWKAQWIKPGYEEPSSNKPSPYFRKSFIINKAIKTAMLYTTSHGMYEAFINGNRVGDAYYTPGWTSYNKRLQYQVYDVTDMLRQDNAIAVILANGWYRGFLGRFNNYGSDIALLLQLEIKYEDGTTERVNSDATWKSSTGKITYSEIYNGEKIDLRLEKEEWMLPQYDDKQWYGVSVGSFGFDNLVGTISEPVKQHEVFKPLKIFTTPKGEQVIDFGQNMAGWVRMKVQGKQGDVITLSHAEVLDRNGNFYTGNLRTAKAQCIYTLKDNQKVILHPHFTWQGFRYLKIEGYPGEININNFEAVALYSSLQTTGQFESSDAMINQLQSNILWSQKGNFLDIPTDCPQRDERLGWTGDIQVFAPTASFNMRSHNFLVKWLRDLEADQLPSGEVPNYIPDLGSNINRAAWADASVIVPWTLYRKYGDVKILRTQYNSMKAYVESVKRVTNNDLWDTGDTFGDWLAYSPEADEKQVPKTTKSLITQAYYVNSLRIMMNTAKVLNFKDDETYYTDLFDRAIKAFRNTFVNTKGKLESQSQTAYSLALNFNLLPDSIKKDAAARLVELIYDFGFFTTGFLTTSPLVHILTDYGYTPLAYRLLERKSYPSWLYPITMGATTFWERWNGIKPNGDFQTEKPQSNSFNHYTHGAIGDWLYRKVAGLDMEDEDNAAGYKYIKIKPYPGGTLTHAKASLDTYYGTIVSGWKQKGDVLEMEIEIPVNTQATVYLPSTQRNAITESGHDLMSAQGIIVKDIPDGNYTVIVIGSGKYLFKLPHVKTPVEIDTDDLRQTIVAWDFNESSTQPSIGAGSIQLTGGVTLESYANGIIADIATVDGIVPANYYGKSLVSTNYPAQETNAKTGGIEMSFSTIGFKNIEIYADLFHSDYSANTIALQYSTNEGMEWNDAVQFNKVENPEKWYLRTSDLFAIQELNNKEKIKLRFVTNFEKDGLYKASRPTLQYNTSGKIHIDNIKIIAEKIQEGDSNEEPADKEFFVFKYKPEENESRTCIALGNNIRKYDIQYKKNNETNWTTHNPSAAAADSIIIQSPSTGNDVYTLRYRLSNSMQRAKVTFDFQSYSSGLIDIMQWGTKTGLVNFNFSSPSTNSSQQKYSSLKNISAQDSVGFEFLKFQHNNIFEGAATEMNKWDVKAITDFSFMFHNANKFNGNISEWDVSRALKFTAMFQAARTFNQDISKWDVGSVTTFKSAFQNAVKFNQNIGNWDVGSSNDFSAAFRLASDFNQDISAWNVSKARKSNQMFESAKMFNQNLSAWTLSSADDISNIFNDCGLSSENYDKIIIGWWKKQELLPDDLTIGVAGMKYASSIDARQNFIDYKNWTFVGDNSDSTSSNLQLKYAQTKITGNTIVFHSIPSSNILVYDLSGKLTGSFPPVKEVNINLRKGFYIVRYDDDCIKFIIK